MYKNVLIGTLPAVLATDSGASVPVTLTGGDKSEPDLPGKVTVTREMSKDDFLAAAKRLGQSKNVQESFLATLASGQTYVLDPALSAPQQAKLAYQKARAKMQLLKADANCGVASADTAVKALASTLDGLFQDAYYD